MCPNRCCILCLATNKRLYHRLGIKHIVLFSLYFAYLLLGATVFYIIEHDNSFKGRARWHYQLQQERSHFVMDVLLPDIFNNSRFLIYLHEHKSSDIVDVLIDKLEHYEKHLDVRPPTTLFKWTYGNALLYAWTCITTIGYGYIYPLTTTGRVASMVYSAFGVPFTLVVLKDMTGLLAKLLNYPGMLVAFCWRLFRYCTLRRVDERTLYKLAGQHFSGKRDYRLRLIQKMLSIPTVVAVFALVGWLSSGAFIFCLWERKWTVFTAFYFLFNSLLTIGIGDVEPSNPGLLLAMFLYIFVGLSVVLLFFNLLHAKFTKAYWLPEPIIKAVDTSGPLPKLASFDEDFELADLDLASYVTLGILHVEERRPLLGALAKERLLKTVETQTAMSMPQRSLIQVHETTSGISASRLIPHRHPHSSTDDVIKLIREQYE